MVILEDCQEQKEPYSGAGDVLLSPYPEDDYCMCRKAAKTKKEN